MVMTVDEYETIRLIDYEGLTQEECAGMMQVARASVQSIYARARRKLSVCLVQGKELKIEGGAFLLEEQPEPSAQMPESDVSAVPCGKTVRIAVPVDASRTSVAASFARSDGFLVVEGGVRTFHGNPLSSHPDAAGMIVAEFLIKLGVSVVLTVRCGVNVGQLLDQAGVAIFKVVGSSVDENLLAWEQGRLSILSDFRQGPAEGDSGDRSL